MAGKATWEYRGDPERPALLVQFSNGTIQTPENVSFTLYNNKGATSPIKSQRILTAQTERLSYVGKNFTPEALKSSSLCRYFVGVLNKETGKMQVYDAEHLGMQPILENNSTEDQQTEETRDQSNLSYREKVDALIEAFGTNKQKRALNSRKLNQVGSEILSKEMAKAAEVIIESRGTTELVQEVAVKKEEESFSLFLPLCNAKATKQEDVYRFDDLLPPAEYASLEEVAAAFRNLTPGELQEKREKNEHGSYVLQELGELKFAKDIDRHARALWYSDTLIKMSKLKMVKRKDLIAMGCPSIIAGSLLKNFTVPTFKNERILNSISATMKCKIVSYVLALALHISDFQVDLTLLQRDLQLTEDRIIEIAKALRLKISKRLMFSDLVLGEGHKMGVLELPLVVYKPVRGRKSSRKL
ncbi:DNA-directed RNA polymerase I subunit RPA49 isoform X2 [Hyla sarda]|uniref:DNA-directed RNA polymerase I subunit RPA49 isoform X2 n=1 Tax=Hyla sarda TaxID=327740 RepID=UPI0024C27E5D|nr:DNA-directed RNA polymerase I subunit RPA49 isoform X2 [Hyla sarda]